MQLDAAGKATFPHDHCAVILSFIVCIQCLLTKMVAINLHQVELGTASVCRVMLPGNNLIMSSSRVPLTFAFSTKGNFV